MRLGVSQLPLQGLAYYTGIMFPTKANICFTMWCLPLAGECSSHILALLALAFIIDLSPPPLSLYVLGFAKQREPKVRRQVGHDKHDTGSAADPHFMFLLNHLFEKSKHDICEIWQCAFVCTDCVPFA